ncbi:MAG: DUF3391 domain-containing protein, partial [Zoogloeaceae bacterium]|nr:DUF3391 domain-containing protein [Zoogloeaceae bacterium]
MIKKISIEDLIPGMHVHDLNCGWMEHPFLTNAFLVDGKARIAKIRSLGIRELYIDTELGLDLPNAPTIKEVEDHLKQRMDAIAEGHDDTARLPPLGHVNEEAPRARKLHSEANQIVQNLMQDIRMGSLVNIERMEPLAESMIDSIFLNQS